MSSVPGAEASPPGGVHRAAVAMRGCPLPAWLQRALVALLAAAGKIALLFAVLLAMPVLAADDTPAGWNTLLAAHVRWNAEGTASSVDYDGFARDRQALQEFLDATAKVERSAFDAWPQAERTAFLLNVYNAQTIALVLTRWPQLDSIKDLGGWFSSPWKKSFFNLLGAQRSLDDIEQQMLRGAPGFDEPRIHFALNCASLGCPALRAEAYRGVDLDAQLDDQTRRFLRDRSRNRYDAARGVLTVSHLFDWYAEDFERGFRGATSVTAFLGLYAAELSDNGEARARIGRGAVSIEYSAYDWSLNRVP